MDAPLTSNRQMVDGVMQLIQYRPEVKEALATRLADELNTTDYGRAIQDHISPETHPHATMYISPYPHAGAGAAAFVTYTDPQNGEIYVLMGLKKEGDLVPPGGYMEVHEPEGGNPNKPYDRNLMETSRRELHEETGLHIPTSYKPESLGACSEYGVTNDPRLHTVLEGFHYNLVGPSAELPKVSGKDDIIGAYWVKASDIHIEQSVGAQPHGSTQTRYSVHTGGQVIPIRDHYGPAFELAVANARGAMLGECSHRMSARKLTFDPAKNPLSEQAHAAWRDTIAKLGAVPAPKQSWAEKMMAPGANVHPPGNSIH